MAALIIVQMVFGLSLLVPTPVQAAQTATPEVGAKAAIAVDATSGRILFSKNLQRRLPMASTTKIMTALTALSIPGTKLTDTYKVVKEDLVGESSMGLNNGEVISFEDLLYGLLLPSGNDAAMAIAHYAGSKLPGTGDSLSRFMAQVNENAAAMGQRNSNYVNPHGFDQENHFTSPYDLAIAGWYALKQPVISKIVATKSAYKAGHALTNNNTLLNRYAGATGIKPGYDLEAGLCLVGSATREGQTVIIVVLGEETSGYQKDPAALLDYSFAQLKLPEIQKTSQSGGAQITATNYIGRPNGDQLIPLTAPLGRGSNNASIVGKPFQGAVINAQVFQINTAIATTTVNPGATTTATATSPTPALTPGSNSGTAPEDPNAKKPAAGFNLLTGIFLVLIAVGLVYFVLRFTPLGGNQGRDISYRMEDYTFRGLQAGRSGASRFWGYLRPGSHEGDTQSAIRPAKRTSGGRTPSGKEIPSYRRAVELDAYDNDEDAYREQAGLEYDGPGRTSGQTSEYAPPGLTTETGPISTRSPGDSFNDRLSGRENTNTSSNAGPRPERPAPPPDRSNPLPPQPLSPRQVNQYPIRTAAEPQQSPDSPTAGYRLPPSNRPATPPPPPANSRPPTPSTSNDFGSGKSRPGDNASYPRTNPAGQTGDVYNAGGLGSSDSLHNSNLKTRARQAIDYAYAGRISASTEEFRRVVEQQPSFDFGSIEEFEQMPVLGYKALANAYREVGKLRHAVLLLEMAEERYPGDLELRNLLRSLKQEIGQ